MAALGRAKVHGLRFARLDWFGNGHSFVQVRMKPDCASLDKRIAGNGYGAPEARGKGPPPQLTDYDCRTGALANRGLMG